MTSGGVKYTLFAFNAPSRENVKPRKMTAIFVSTSSSRTADDRFKGFERIRRDSIVKNLFIREKTLA